MTGLKEVSKISGLEDFHGYYVDMNGNVYSARQKNRGLRKITTFRSGVGPNYKKVILCGKNSKTKAFYIHILVGKLFIPKSNQKRYIVHKTENIDDNSIDNIISVNRYKLKSGHNAGRPRKEIIKELEKESIISDNVVSELKILYKACLIKGAHLSSEFDFFNEIITELIDEYANRKGLKKILYQLKNEQ